MGDQLPPPTGWFAIGSSADFPAGEAVPTRWFDQDLVIFRSQDGNLGALDAYCRHLGAHLGQGGTVCGDAVTCPFHGWRWAVDGSCVAVPYGDRKPPKIRTQSIPAVDQDGVVLLWHGAHSPSWQMPRFDEHRWTEPVTMRRRVQTHPQEVLENTADLAHFRFVHRTHMFEAESDVRIDGHVFEQEIRSAPDAVTPELRLDGETRLKGTVFCHGPGLAGATIGPANLPVHALQRLYATPLGEDEVMLLGVVNVRIDDDCDEATAEAFIEAIGGAVFENWDRDISIWEHKQHLRRPALKPTERSILRFRSWYSQYYGNSPALGGVVKGQPAETG